MSLRLEKSEYVKVQKNIRFVRENVRLKTPKSDPF